MHLFIFPLVIRSKILMVVYKSIETEKVYIKYLSPF